MNDTANHNESSISYCWVKQQFALDVNENSSPIATAWMKIRDSMRNTKPQVVYTQDWVSDFWLSRSFDTEGSFALAPMWNPPDLIDEWPVINIQPFITCKALPNIKTSNKIITGLFENAVLPANNDNYEAVDKFMFMKNNIKYHADINMVQKEHIRAWIGTAIGHLLMGIVLSPKEETHDLVQGTIQRLSIPLQTKLPDQWINDFEDRRIELLYNKRLSTRDRVYLDNLAIQSGQGEEWREHWDWLSFDISARETAEAVRIAASILRCPALINGLMIALLTGDKYLETIAVAVIRRLLLTLKVMTWLEAALQQEWKYARARDVSCFAFNAVKPDWPRRPIGISHRSRDVKEALASTNLWMSCYCAIDATYIPSWETNTGMMWGLFAGASSLIRIQSKNYLNSIWCLRENELIEYLVNKSDFLEQRWITDINEAQIPTLNKIFTDSFESSYENIITGNNFKSFPPLCDVWMAPILDMTEVKTFRAAAALRLMRVLIGDSNITNRVAAIIEKGVPLSQPAPTNNPDGWHSYAAVFKALSSLCNTNPDNQPIHLDNVIDPNQMRIELELCQRIPDLSNNNINVNDVFTAFEWLITEWPLIINEKSGSFLVIDCRDITKEQWLNDERLSLLRGLAAVRTFGPLWYIQKAGQDVEHWPLIGERPIFTEHFSNQFTWMFEILFDRKETKAQYQKNSGLHLSDTLIKILQESG
jgi:hypothetical protein